VQLLRCDFKVAIPREMYPDIKDGGYMTYDYEYEVDQHEMSDLQTRCGTLRKSAAE